MTRIAIKNGTTSIDISCASLTTLKYFEITNKYMCEYSDWAYGLFAICSVVALVIPILIIINCVIKCHIERKKQAEQPSLSRTTSYSSVNLDHPSSYQSAALERIDELDVHEHKPQKAGKSYYPYPAYGTFDEASFRGSTTSLSPEKSPILENHNKESQNIPIKIPSLGNEQQPLLHNISSSAPVVNSMLKTQRQNHSPDKYVPPAHSLIDLDTKSESSLAAFRQNLRNDSRSVSPSSFTTISSSDLLKDNPEESSSRDEKKDGSNNSKIRTGSFISAEDKNRILSATPEKNMITRQDFDDYLVDCVLKLPEDQRNGTFLIRNSTSAPSNKVLTLYCKSPDVTSTLYYYKIYYTDDDFVYLENEKETFTKVDELIEYYQSHKSILACLLGESLGKNF